MRLIIISGRSGSGKSICLHVLEDLGFYCIDNLPASLLPNLIEHVKNQYKDIAIGIDARNLPDDLDKFHDIISEYTKAGMSLEIIYLDADSQTLIKRYSETRRKHPLSSADISLQEAINQESQLLQPIAHLANLRIDTSHFTMHQLRAAITQRVQKHGQQMSVLFQSFGFKFGVPQDSDFVFDVRCLPNPYWHPELRPYTGLDQKIINFLQESDQSKKMLKDIENFISHWLDDFKAGNRSYMTIAIGCTGGQHRSVYIAQCLYDLFTQLSPDVQVRHRELQ